MLLDAIEQTKLAAFDGLRLPQFAVGVRAEEKYLLVSNVDGIVLFKKREPTHDENRGQQA